MLDASAYRAAIHSPKLNLPQVSVGQHAARGPAGRRHGIQGGGGGGENTTSNSNDNNNNNNNNYNSNSDDNPSARPSSSDASWESAKHSAWACFLTAPVQGAEDGRHKLSNAGRRRRRHRSCVNE